MSRVSKCGPATLLLSITAYYSKSALFKSVIFRPTTLFSHLKTLVRLRQKNKTTNKAQSCLNFRAHPFIFKDIYDKLVPKEAVTLQD